MGILGISDPSHGHTEGGDPLGRPGSKIFIKIIKLGHQGSISPNYIVLQSPRQLWNYNFIGSKSEPKIAGPPIM